MDFLQDKIKKKQFLCNYSVFLLNGMLALSIGSLLPFIRDARGLDYAFCGLIVSLHSVGNLFSSFTAGLLPVAIGRKKSILFFNLFFALSYVLIIFGNHNWCIAMAFFLTGVARGATSNFCNTAINSLAPGKAWTINGLHAMFSVGAFLFPILLTLFTATGESGWITACYFMLAMGILSWILYAMIPMENDRVEKEKKDGSFGFFSEPLFYLCVATLFFYLCAEQGVIGWMITYFKDTGFLPASLSQMTASVLWVMILAGRLTTAWLSTRMQKEKLLPIMGVGLVCFFFLLLFSRSTVWIVIGITNLGKLNTVAMAALFILTLILCKVIFFGDYTAETVAADGLTFGAAVELAVAMPLSWLPLISDYTREAKQPVKATAVSAIVYGVISCWMYLIGMGAAIYTGESDIAQIMVKAGLGIVGLLIIIFSTVTTTFLDAYSAGISSETLSHKLNGKYIAIAVTVVGALAAIVYPMDNITNFLYLIGSVFAPMIAIQIADFFLLKEDYSEKEIQISNMVLWIIGFILYRILMRIDIPVGNTLPDIAITVVLCLIWGKISKKK